MKKVLIKTDDKKVSILYKTEDEEIIDVTGHTNIINTEELLFSEKYLKVNTDVIATFIRGVILSKKVNTLDIVDEGLIDVSLDISKRIKEIKKIYISSDKPLKFENYEKLINYKNINYLNCYDMQPFMLEELDRDDLKIDLRSEACLFSSFITLNNLNHYSDIYYKTVLKINGDLNDDDVNDFNTFCKINRKLK